MLLLCHRGHHQMAPENSLDAFARALACGADGIETDVRLSADGKLVLAHDRVTRSAYREVAALTHAQLSDALGHPVPILEDALAYSANILWNLHIKTPAAVAPTLLALARYRHTRRFFITSTFYAAALEMSRGLDADCGVVVEYLPHDPDILFRFFDVHKGQKNLNTISWDYEIIDEALLREASRRGIRNFVFGAHSEAEHRHLAQLGVDGVITDHPEFILSK